MTGKSGEEATEGQTSAAITVAYDATTGEEAWTTRYASAGLAGGWDLALNPGEPILYVAIRDEARTDPVVAAYDAETGDHLWTAAADPSPEVGQLGHPAFLEVAPDGSKVFATTSRPAPGDTPTDYVTTAYEATTGKTLWTSRYAGPAQGGDVVTDIAQSGDGDRVYVTGSSYGETDRDIATVAYEATTGEEQWVARYDGGADDVSFDRGFPSIVTAHSGDAVYVVGSSASSGTGFDAVTLAYDGTTGEQQWVQRAPGPGEGQGRGGPADGAVEALVDPQDDTIYVGGYTDLYHSQDPTKYRVIAYNATTGAEEWASLDDGGILEDPFPGGGLTMASDGTHVYLAGEGRGPGASSRGISTGYDLYVAAFDTATGEVPWTTVTTGPGDSFDEPADIAVSPDGSRVHVTGKSAGFGLENYGFGYLTATFSAEGELLWTARFDSALTGGNSQPEGLAVSPDGDTVYVTGGSAAADGTGVDYLTIAYDAETGEELWLTRYEGAVDQFPDQDECPEGVCFIPVKPTDRAYDIEMSPDGEQLYITGKSGQSYNETTERIVFDAVTVAYNATTGEQAWVARYDGPAGLNAFVGDEATALEVSPDGTAVYIAGEAERENHNSDPFTVAYDTTTGTELWSQTFRDRHCDAGFTDLAVAHDDSQVYATGVSSCTTAAERPGPDTPTVAYDATTGGEAWEAHRPVLFSSEVVPQIEVNPNGGSVYTAALDVSEQWAVRAFHADSGLPEWENRYPDAGLGSPSDLEVNPDGSRVYATGHSQHGWDKYFATVAYEALTGGVLWQTEHLNSDVLRWDVKPVVAVSSDGSGLYTAGMAGNDFAVLGYDTCLVCTPDALDDLEAAQGSPSPSLGVPVPGLR